MTFNLPAASIGAVTSPYRSGKPVPASNKGDGGIVDELVRQFADKFAFLRELVQNALDADATRIDVRVMDQDGGVRVSVRDDGAGMEPQVLQDKLLVMFQSGKEGQEDKIGKFGVGFISVLAIEPERVVIRTSTGNELYTLHLASDHSYELFEREGDGTHGTTVTLEVPRLEMQADEFARLCEEALRRWCRHAAVPIHLLVVLGESSEHSRIDEPLALDAERVAVEHTEQTKFGRILVGIPWPWVSPRVEFFNRGLTLFESDKPIAGPLLSRLEIKIQDRRLEHTLSRDNVRRDAAYVEVIEATAKTARKKLGAAILAAIRQAAERDDSGDVLGACTDYFQLLDVDPRSISVPLLHPVEGRRVVPVASLSNNATFQQNPDALSRALVDAGRHVLCSRAEDWRRFYTDELGLHASESAATAVIPVPLSGSDLALVEEVQRAVSVHRAPSGCGLVELVGFGAERTFLGGKPSDKVRVLVGASELDKSPFRLLMRPDLLLNVAHPLVARLRLFATEDSATAGALLARLVLADAGELSINDDAALTRAAIYGVLGMGEE